MVSIYEQTYDFFSKNPNKKTSRHSESLKTLLSCEINQQQSIKLGNAVERILMTYIQSSGVWKDVRIKPKTNEKERDHLFQNQEGERVYVEVKSNIQLDSEKKKETKRKVLYIANQENTKPRLLALRYFDESEMRVSRHINYYRNAGIDVISISCYFKDVLKIKCPFENADEYVNWLNYVASYLLCEDIDTDDETKKKVLKLIHLGNIINRLKNTI